MSAYSDTDWIRAMDELHTEVDKLGVENIIADAIITVLKVENEQLRAALEQARTAILSDLVWLTPNVGGWQLDRAREATEKSLKQIEAALTNERKP